MPKRKLPTTPEDPKDQSIATPPGESGADPAAKAMSEPDPSALSHHPAREAAIHAAAEARQSPKSRTARAKSEPDRKAREAAAAAHLHPDLPSALRALAADDRVTVRRDGPPDPDGKTVVYWMQRAERAVDNHALDTAILAANALALPVVVYFAGVSNFPNANLRHYIFLNEGLQDVAADCARRNCTFILRNAPREDHLTLFRDVGAALVIGDENPMRVPEGWRQHVAANLNIPFWTVDADVIVPSKLFPKAQFAAYTMRPRLWRLVPDYLQPSENPIADHAWHRPENFFADDPASDMTAGWPDLDRSVGKAPELTGGAHAAHARLDHFVTKLLPGYASNRNHPDIDGTSVLSPYLHYGHISPITITLAIEAAVENDPKLRESADSFLDELVTWRELCINYARYNPHYDDPECAEPWARQTIADHAADPRDQLYTLDQLERAETYDDLWNAAQRQMVMRGWMHNFMRMYWAKKVLEWSPDNATAMRSLIYLNDKYFVDGRDPSGYAGIAWAIYGKFDRPWFNRPIFGKIRYMSGKSTGGKFNSAAYIAQHSSFSQPTSNALSSSQSPQGPRARRQLSR